MRYKSVPKKRKTKEYGTQFREQLNNPDRIFCKKRRFISEVKKSFIENKEITKKIGKLPKEIQNKIYIFRMNKYWRDDILERPLKPMWCDYKKYMDNEIKKCYFENIHFLHLECNSVPELREWIPGCQCDFCLNDKKVKKKKDIYSMILSDQNNFYKYVHCYDYIPNVWNSYMIFKQSGNMLSQFKVFDNLKGYIISIDDMVKTSPQDVPLNFNYL
jgi:hypothetical protein